MNFRIKRTGFTHRKWKECNFLLCYHGYDSNITDSTHGSGYHPNEDIKVFDKHRVSDHLYRNFKWPNNLIGTILGCSRQSFHNRFCYPRKITISKHILHANSFVILPDNKTFCSSCQLVLLSSCKITILKHIRQSKILTAELILFYE